MVRFTVLPCSHAVSLVFLSVTFWAVHLFVFFFVSYFDNFTYKWIYFFFPPTNQYLVWISPYPHDIGFRMDLAGTCAKWCNIYLVGREQFWRNGRLDLCSKRTNMQIGVFLLQGGCNSCVKVGRLVRSVIISLSSPCDLTVYTYVYIPFANPTNQNLFKPPLGDLWNQTPGSRNKSQGGVGVGGRCRRGSQQTNALNGPLGSSGADTSSCHIAPTVTIFEIHRRQVVSEPVEERMRMPK